MGFAMTSNDEQQHVVQRILRSYLEGEDLESAVSLWMNQYSRQSIDKLSYFVFEIATTSALRALRKDILGELEKGLQNTPPLQATARDECEVNAIIPENNETVSTLKVSTAIPASTDRVNGINYFFEQVLKHLQGFDLVDIIELTEEYLKDSDIPKYVQRDFLKWMSDREDLSGSVQHDSDIQMLINTLYGVLCEYLGPMKSDRLMAQAIASVDKMYPNALIKQCL